MTTEREDANAREDADPAASLERIWEEIKEISRQVERETRRSGRIARLRLDMRKIRRDLTELRAELGEAVYEAQRREGDSLPLAEVDGFREAVDAIDGLLERLDEKGREVEELKKSGAADGGQAAAASAGSEA